MTQASPPVGTDYDVVVVGGAFSGAATALLLKRWLPKARVLILERQSVFDQKVGEATVEVSAHFLHQVLGLYDDLSRVHLPKHGLRYWFSDRPDRSLAEMSEVGPNEVPRLPAFQLDRAKLDERILEVASEAGAELVRPARVTEIDLAWPSNRVRFEDRGRTREVTCRWVVDGTGRSTFLAKKLGLRRKTEAHPTAAAWGRWKGIKDLDGPAVLGTDARKPNLPPLDCARRLATNHFCGYGWWCWFIPLGGGETSIGVVHNKELYDLPNKGAPAMDRYRAFLETQAGTRELIAGAELDEADFRRYTDLPYHTTAYAGRGWALVGDAASFIDPYYSPGLDHASMSAFATAHILEEDLGKHASEAVLDARLARHNEEFVRSYHRWTEALYLGKYELFGDAELTTTAFILDTALYYLGVFAPIHRDLSNLKNPVLGLSLPQADAAFQFIRFYNRRLVALARQRRVRGTYGKKNVGWRVYLGDVGLGFSTVRKLTKGLAMWGQLELDGLWSLLSRKKMAHVPLAPANPGSIRKELAPADRELEARPD